MVAGGKIINMALLIPAGTVCTMGPQFYKGGPNLPLIRGLGPQFNGGPKIS